MVMAGGAVAGLRGDSRGHRSWVASPVPQLSSGGQGLSPQARLEKLICFWLFLRCMVLLCTLRGSDLYTGVAYGTGSVLLPSAPVPGVSKELTTSFLICWNQYSACGNHFPQIVTGRGNRCRPHASVFILFSLFWEQNVHRENCTP